MKKIAYMVLIVMLTQIGLANTNALGFPDEPMTIYGNVTGASVNDILSVEVYDGNNTMLYSGVVVNQKYGTDYTFNIADKINLNTYTGALNFKIIRDGIRYNVNTVTKGNIALCNNTPVFQKGNLCQYNLDITLPAATVATSINNVSIDLLSALLADLNTKKAIVSTIQTDLLSALLADLAMSDVNKTVSTQKIIVANKKIDTSTGKIILEDTLLLSALQTTVEKKNTLFLPKNINLSKNNITIDTPREIVDKVSIKNKIGKGNVVGAVDIPTSSNVGFTNNKIQVCMYVNNSNTKGKIYSSIDSINWSLDNNISNLQVANNQACFNVNHLTSFAVVEDTPPIAPVVSSGGGGGGGGSSYYSRTLRSNTSSSDNSSKSNTGSTNTGVVVNESINTVTSEKITVDTVIEMNSRDYIKSIVNFNSNRKNILNTYKLKAFTIKGDDIYNGVVEKLVKKITYDLKIVSLRIDLGKFLDKMTTSYGIYTDETIDQNIRDKFQQKFTKDKLIFEARYNTIKVKDYIINKTLQRRAVEKQKALEKK